MTRTWVLLPQGMYPAEWRDMYSTIGGGEIFGNLKLSKVGGLEYELYSGLQRPQLNGGLASLQRTRGIDLASINSPLSSGGQLWWRTPLDGLRLGAALNYDKDLTYVSTTGTKTVGSPFVQKYSIDYSWHAWTFQAEYFTYKIDYDFTRNGTHLRTVHIEPDSWYTSVAYRFNNWFEAGTYYTEYYPSTRQRSGGPDQFQRDLAVALRFDPTQWWILKVEGHMIQGTGNLAIGNARTDKLPANPPARDRDERWWPMLALKSTFTF